MNALLLIWLAMRIVSFALLSFVTIYIVGGYGWSELWQAMTLQDLAPYFQSPIASSICAILWVVWAAVSWKFLFGK